MPAGTSTTPAVPFSAATHRYREKWYTSTFAMSATTQDVSPTGNIVKSYPPYLRAIELCVTNSVAASTGGTTGADWPWNIFSQCAVTQPGGEEMFGGPTFTGPHTYYAACHSGWRFANDPATMPSYSNSATNPQFVLPIVFEINAQYGVGSLPNADASAPWKIQLTGNSTSAYTTAPTTTNPTFLVAYMANGWTLPSPQAPLNPNLTQQTAPDLLGTLNKWTVQQIVIPSNSSFNAPLVRKGNAIRNLVFIALASGVRSTTAQFPDPLTVKWDGTVLRSSDKPLLVIDDEYHTRGGQAAATATTPVPGLMSFQMSDLSGLDAEATATGYGMDPFWTTTQTSTLEVDGTWGSSITALAVLTNDVQFVNLAQGNPYAFAYGGFLQAPAQPSSRS